MSRLMEEFFQSPQFKELTQVVVKEGEKFNVSNL